MAKTYNWRDIFRYNEKPKIPVQVGGKFEDLTGTQAGRFEELTECRQALTPTASSGLRKVRYTLAEAASCLNVTEARLLQQAATGSNNCFIDARGIRGRWHRDSVDGQSIGASSQTLASGYLALDADSCEKMAQYGSVNVSYLEFRHLADASAISLDHATMAKLSAEGECDIYFRFNETLWVDLSKVLLLAPLPGVVS